jgi:UDP-N-acetylglucosamine 2-epimerase (non-hydrolysing)
VTIERLRELARRWPVVFPAHPRTRKEMTARGIAADDPSLRVIDPVGYIEFLGLLADAAGVVTDSGGIQEETTFLGVPCFTLRNNTERPITLTHGTNHLLGLAPERIEEVPALIDAARARPPIEPPPFWDGHAAARVVDVLEASVGPAMTDAPSRTIALS